MKRRIFIKSALLSLCCNAIPALQIYSEEKAVCDICSLQLNELGFDDLSEILIAEIASSGSGVVDGIIKKTNSTFSHVENQSNCRYKNVSRSTSLIQNIEHVKREMFSESKFSLKRTKVLFICAFMEDLSILKAACELAKTANRKNILTIGVFHVPEINNKTTLEFSTELKSVFDTQLLIPKKLKQSGTPDSGGNSEKDTATEIINGIVDMITSEGILNFDFTDLKHVAMAGNYMTFGIGKGWGKNGMISAAEQAMPNDMDLIRVFRKASHILIQIKAGNKYSLLDMSKAADHICQDFSSNVEVTFGIVTDNSSYDECEILLLANG